MVGYYGLPFVMSLYLQQLRGLSALGAGVGSCLQSSEWL
jgi:MFS transporter, DHA2 family, methylenomycin A resistance protein